MAYTRSMTRMHSSFSSPAVTVTVRCVHTPCHTNGHMSYLASADEVAAPVVFTGDILFVGGCGRFFEGGPDQMCASSAALAALPPTALVYCGHEYTVKNLQVPPLIPSSPQLASLAPDKALPADRLRQPPRPDSRLLRAS